MKRFQSVSVLTTKDQYRKPYKALLLGLTLTASHPSFADNFEIYEYSSKTLLQTIPNDIEHEVLQLDEQWCLVLLKEPAIKVWLSETFVQRIKDRVVVNANALNARLAPTLKATVLTQLGRGTTGKVLDAQNGFVQVMLNTEFIVAAKSTAQSCVNYRDRGTAPQVSHSAAPTSTIAPLELTEPSQDVISLYEITLEGQRAAISNGSEVLSRQGKTFLPVDLLTTANIKIPKATAIQLYQDENYIALDDLENLSYTINASTQSLNLTLKPAGFTLFRVDGGAKDASGNVSNDNMSALFMDYRLSAYGNEHDLSYGVSLRPSFTFSKSALTTQFISRDLADDTDFVRLETQWVRDFQDLGLRLVAGDAVSTRARGSSSVGSSYHFGGVQLGTNFSLNPNETTHPLPTIFGEAASQSTIELYINESLAFRGETRAGPFVLERPPLMNGNGNLQVVVRDLLGRETVIDTPFNVNAKLLEPGTSDWQLNLGSLRENLGSTSNDYGERFAAYRYRRGITDYLTTQGVFEYSESLKLMGVSSGLLIPKLGLLSAGAQVSNANDQQGTRTDLALQNSFKRFNFSIRGSKADQKYRSLGRVDFAESTENTFVLSIGARLTQNISASFSQVSRSSFDGTDANVSGLLVTRGVGQNGQLSLSASLTQGRELRFANKNSSLEKFDDYSINLNYSHSLSGRRALAFSHARKSKRRQSGQSIESNRSSVTFRRSSPIDLGTGYSATLNYEDAQAGSFSDARLSAQKNTQYGQFDVGLNADRHQNFSYSGNYEGSLLWAENRIFAQKPLREGFAVVKLGELPGVTIYRENRPSTITNQRGLAVITGLQPYSWNHISVKDKDIPINATISGLDLDLMPRYFGAIDADFELKHSVNQLVKILDTNKRPLASGTQVISQDSNERYFVAKGGQAYLTDLNDNQRFVAQSKDQKCDFELSLYDLRPNREIVIECTPLLNKT